MLWTLWDVVIPMAVAFGTGLLFGWLLWRWQRIRVSADELLRLRRDTGRLKADNERLRDRLVDSQGRSRLRAERQDGRSQRAVGAERRTPDARGAHTRGLQAPANDPVRRAEKPASDAEGRAAETLDATAATTLDNVDELRRALEARDRMIDTLRHSLAQQQDQADSVLMAAELAARNRKINALEELLSAQIQHSES